jgi:hypothetical protein
MIEADQPAHWRELQERAARILQECGFTVELEKTLPSVRGEVESDVYAVEVVGGRLLVDGAPEDDRVVGLERLDVIGRSHLGAVVGSPERFGERLAYLGCRAVPGREGDEAIAHGAVSAGTTSTGPRL